MKCVVAFMSRTANTRKITEAILDEARLEQAREFTRNIMSNL